MNTQVQAKPDTSVRAPRAVVKGKRIPYGDPVYFRTMDFYNEEARMLDEGRFDDWFELLEPDLFYFMAHRRTLDRGSNEFDIGSYWYYENIDCLNVRVKKYTLAKSYFAEDPPSRVRRFISTVTLFESATPDELIGQTSLLLLSNRQDQDRFAILSCLREDVLRPNESHGFHIAQRDIRLDQSTLGLPTISFLL